MNIRIQSLAISLALALLLLGGVWFLTATQPQPAALAQAPPPARIQATGGPDAFGYVYTDSITTPALYAWVDIADSGTRVAFSDPDTAQKAVALPQPFTFYGQAYTQLYVTTNGYASFGNTAVVTQCRPAEMQPPLTLAAFCADLVSGTVYYSTTTAYNGHDAFIVQYDSVTHTLSGLTLTFQIVLDLVDDNITYQYLHAPAAGVTGTVGIIGYAANRADYLTYCQDATCVALAETAVRFARAARPELTLALWPNNDFPLQDEVVTYTLVLGNIGQAPALGATLANTLPVGLDYVTGTASAGVLTPPDAARVLRWAGDLAPGAAVTLTYAAQLLSATPLYNTAVLHHPQAPEPAGATSTPADAWSAPEPIDLPRYFYSDFGSRRYVAMDSHGTPHVAYGGDQLYYAVYSGTEWLPTVVPITSTFVAGAALWLDAQNQPHIAFKSGGINTTLWVAHGMSVTNGLSWTLESVATLDGYSFNVGDLDLQQGSDGVFHLAYNFKEALYYTHSDAGRWLTPTEVITKSACSLRQNASSNGFSLALDAANTPHVACPRNRPGSNELRLYTAGASAPWTTYEVAANNVFFYDLPSLRYIDNTPHLAFFLGNDELYHAVKAGAWQLTRVDTITDLDLQMAANLTLGGETLGIAYAKYSFSAPYTTTVRVASRPLAGGSWVTTVVTTTPYRLDKIGGALDAAGAHTVIFFDDTADLLRGARAADAFAVQTIDESRRIIDAAVVLTADGATHVPYIAGGLRYARLLTPTMTWERSVIDRAAYNDYDLQIAAALDAGGTLHVGYFNAAGALWHAARSSAGEWTKRPVDNPGPVAEKVVSVGAADAGAAHFAYNARVSGNYVLRHAQLSGGTWSTETLATLGPDTLWSGLAPRLVTQGGKIYILYLDCTRYQSSGDYPIALRLLTWDGGWSGQTLYNFAGQCGFRIQINLVSDGDAQVAALADINSNSVRPNPLHLEYWIAGGDGGLHITQGYAASAAGAAGIVGAARAGLFGTGGKPAPTMIRGNGLETFGISYYDKYATYSGNGYRSSAVTVGSTSGSTALKGGARSGKYGGLVEQSYGNRPGLYMEYIIPKPSRCCLRTAVAPGLAAAAGASASPAYTEGPCGHQVTVSASEPERGWQFTHWSGAASGGAKEALATLSGQIPDCSLATANFEPIPEATGMKSANPAAPLGVYPDKRITYTLNLSWKNPLDEAIIRITDPYPWQRADFVASTLAWGNYIASCTDNATQHTVTCNGKFPESEEGVSTWVRFSMQATCGLYAQPGPVVNQPTIQVGTFQFTPAPQTAVNVPFLLKTSSPGFVPQASFAGGGERPNSSILLYTVPKGDEPHCCTNCTLDVYVVVDGDMAHAIKMTNNGGGVNDRTQADFVANDCQHSAWFRPTDDKTYKLELYVVAAGGKVEDAHLADTLNLPPVKQPELVVLTDLRELFNEFERVTPNAPGADSNNNCVRDYYEALERLRKYAADHNGLLFDVRQDAYYADLDYTNDANRASTYLNIDWLISRLPKASLRHLAVIGDDAVLPFYRYADPKPNDESRYLSNEGSHNLPAVKDTLANMILTDVPYSVYALTNAQAPLPDFGLGRIFADTPLKLLAMVDAYETPIPLGAAQGSAFVFSIANEITTTKPPCPVVTPCVTFDWQGNTRGAAITPLTNAGYTIPTTNLADRSLPRRRGWFDAEAGFKWRDVEARTAFTAGGGNRLTILNSHAAHLYQTTAYVTSTLQSVDILGTPLFPGSLIVNLGCHGGYATGFDGAAAGWNYYRHGLAHAALDRHITWVASTTYGQTTAGPAQRYHDRIHEQFLRQALGAAATVGEARRLALRAYTTYHALASFEARDIIGLYGTALYGLPTQEINHGGVRASVQARPLWLPAAAALALPHAASLDVSLAAEAFTTFVDADGATWFSVANAEEYTALANGPVTPLLVRRVILPEGSGDVQVTLVASVTAAYPGAVMLPLQRAGDKTFGVETVPYTGTTRYPDPLFWTTIFTDSGATELVISAIPLQYDPVAHTVTLLHRLDFAVQYTAPGGGAALSGLVVDGDNVVQRNQVTAAIQATATLASGGTYTLRWQVEDAAGHPLGSGASAATLTAGGNALSWTADSGLWEPGAKVMQVTLMDATGAVIAAGARDFEVAVQTRVYLPLVLRNK